MASSWMRAGLGSRGRRLLSAALAIIIGVAFLTTSLAVLLSAKAGVEESVAGGLRDADLVVASTDGIDAEAYAAVEALPEVADLTGDVMVAAQTGPEDYVFGVPLPRSGVVLLDGRLPSAEGEVLADAALIEAGHEVGSELGLRLQPGQNDNASSVTLQIVGAVETSGMGPASFGPTFLAADPTLRMVEPGLYYNNLQIGLADDASDEEARTAVGEVLSGATFQTGAEAAEEQVNALTGDTAVMAAILVGFGTVALVTAAIVIANTFTITLAQRTGELALLRCVGATKSQVRRSVLLEAVLLGVVASAVGVVVGVLAAWGLLELARRSDLGIPEAILGGSGSGLGVHLDAVTLLVPLLVGTLVTVLASLWPATKATRVSPLAALRPEGQSSELAKIGWGRVVMAVLLLGLGVALMVLAATSGSIAAGLAGGLISFAGVLVGAVILVPAAVRFLGFGARAAGVPGRLAVDNAVRNPGRAAATSAALIVGVTLITMTSVGAASGEQTAMREIDQAYAVDLMAVTRGGQILPEEELDAGSDGGRVGEGEVASIYPEMDAATPDQLRAVDGVTAVTPVDLAFVQLGESWGESTAVGLDPATAGETIRSTALVDSIRPGVLGLGNMDQAIHGLEPGDTVTVTGAAGSKELTIVELGLGYGRLAMHQGDLRELAGEDAHLAGALIRVDDRADVADAFSAIQEVTGEAEMDVEGPLVQRAVITQVLDILVLVTTALLGVAVVIAIVGIANTLSLSIIERQREHALLRGLGLTSGQMRMMLLVEGVLLALVSAVIGLVLGIVYAFLGVQTVLPEGTPVELAVPWGTVGIIVAVALVAGVLSSVLPARRATKVSPAQGLAAA